MYVSGWLVSLSSYSSIYTGTIFVNCNGKFICVQMCVHAGFSRRQCKDSPCGQCPSQCKVMCKTYVRSHCSTYLLNAPVCGRCFGETLSTLNFARRAKMIRNKAVVNEDTSGTVQQLQSEIRRLKQLVERLKSESEPLSVEMFYVTQPELMHCISCVSLRALICMFRCPTYNCWHCRYIQSALCKLCNGCICLFRNGHGLHVCTKGLLLNIMLTRFCYVLFHHTHCVQVEWQPLFPFLPHLRRGAWPCYQAPPLLCPPPRCPGEGWAFCQMIPRSLEN